MKFKQVDYIDNHTRIVSGYLFIPKNVNGETRVFSFESWEERIFSIPKNFRLEWVWIPTKWVDR